MKDRSSRTGGNALKLFLLLFAFLLGAFVAPWPAVDGADVLEHSDGEFPVAMHVEGDKHTQKLQKPFVLIMRVAEWRLWHSLFKRDLLRFDYSSNLAAVRMTCRAYRISFRGRSRFQDTKARVSACVDRALAFLNKTGHRSFFHRVYEVMEKHVNRLLKFSATDELESSTGSDTLTVVDTIDNVSGAGRTTFFYFCQKTSPWDKKTSKCLGASEINYRSEFLFQYTTNQQDLANDDASLEWDPYFVPNPDDEVWTEGSGRKLRLLRPLKVIKEEPSAPVNIIFIDLVGDEKSKWWFTVKTEKGAGGGEIVTVSCNTDITPGWSSGSRKTTWRKKKTFSGLDMNHANWCLSKVSMESQHKATDVYVASSHIATLQGLFRQFNDKNDGKRYRCILKDPLLDAKLTAKLDAALWESYLLVSKKPWKVVKYQYGRSDSADHCTGYFEIEFSPEIWSMTYRQDKGEKVWEPQGDVGKQTSLVRLDLTTSLLDVHEIAAAGSRTEMRLPGTRLIILQRREQTPPMPLSVSLHVQPSPSSDNCEASIGILDSEGDIRELVIFPDPIDYDIRSTQIFRLQGDSVDV